jgi:anti-sigma regulatory factor (Ser/Thr protein kinase)
MDAERKLTFPGRFDSLAPISEFVTRAAEAAGLDERAVYAVQLAVDEASTNVIEHAYGGEGRGEIEITCSISSDGLTVTLRDHGPHFDPESVPSPDLHATLEERNARGLGLYLMRQLMDEVRFDFASDSGNILLMVKRKKPLPRSDTG